MGLTCRSRLTDRRGFCKFIIVSKSPDVYRLHRIIVLKSKSRFISKREVVESGLGSTLSFSLNNKERNKTEERERERENRSRNEVEAPTSCHHATVQWRWKRRV